MNKISKIFSIISLFTASISLSSCENYDFKKLDEPILINKDTNFIDNTLTFEELNSYKDIYRKNTNKFLDLSKDIRVVAYYGSYYFYEYKIAVLALVTYGMEPQVEINITLGNNTLTFSPPSYLPYVFYQNNMYTLEEAYKSNIIDDHIVSYISLFIKP